MTTCGCGEAIAEGAAFCGACGRPRPVDAAPTAATDVPPAPPVPPAAGAPPTEPVRTEPSAEASVVDPVTGQVSTPWPESGRRRSTPNDPLTTPLPGGATAAFPATPLPASGRPPPPVAPTPPPGVGVLPPGPPGAPPRRSGSEDRTAAYVLGGLVALLLVAVLVLSLVLLSRGGSGEETTDGTAPSSVPPTTPSTVAPTATTPTTPSTEAPTSAPTTPSTVPPTAPPTTPSTAPPPSTAPAPEPTAPVASAEAMTATFDGYISALDRGDLDLAYSYVAPSLRARDGWSYDEFVAFWQEAAIGANVVRIDSTAPGSGALTATVDYHLPDGATSRESIRARVGPVGDGSLGLVDYEVLDTTRI